MSQFVKRYEIKSFVPGVFSPQTFLSLTPQILENKTLCTCLNLFGIHRSLIIFFKQTKVKGYHQH